MKFPQFSYEKGQEIASSEHNFAKG